MAGELEGRYDIHHADRSALLLTGGASRRMGFDKASIMIGGEPISLRLSRILRAAGWEPTILGRTPLKGFAYQADSESFGGPLSALRKFTPKSDLIFVLSCDVPLFRAEILEAFEGRLGDKQAVIPSLNERLQPLCGLYRREAWDRLDQLESSRVMDWIGLLEVEVVSECDLIQSNLQPNWCKGVNTPSELSSMLESGNLAIE